MVTALKGLTIPLVRRHAELPPSGVFGRKGMFARYRDLSPGQNGSKKHMKLSCGSNLKKRKAPRFESCFFVENVVPSGPGDVTKFES